MTRRLVRIAVALVAITVALPLAARDARSCVGMTITIGYVDTPEYAAAAKILSTLIVERTGTSTELYPLEDLDAVHYALTDLELGIGLLPVGYGAARLSSEGVEPTGDAYDFVRSTYSKSKTLVWLRTLGFTAPGEDGWLTSGAPSAVSPVVRKDIVQKFPAMPRLIEKMGGRLSPDKLGGVVAAIAAGTRTTTVARRFLEREKLI